LLTSIISTIILAQSKALVSLTAKHPLKTLAENKKQMEIHLLL